MFLLFKLKTLDEVRRGSLHHLVHEDSIRCIPLGRNTLAKGGMVSRLARCRLTQLSDQNKSQLKKLVTDLYLA